MVSKNKLNLELMQDNQGIFHQITKGNLFYGLFYRHFPPSELYQCDWEKYLFKNVQKYFHSRAQYLSRILKICFYIRFNLLGKHSIWVQLFPNWMWLLRVEICIIFVWTEVLKDIEYSNNNWMVSTRMLPNSPSC